MTNTEAHLRRQIAELEQRLSTYARAEAAELHNARGILDTIPVPIFVKDTAGVYRSCNAAFAHFLGLPREAIVGRTAHHVAPAHLAEIYHQADLALMTQGATQVYEARVIPASGEAREVRFHKAVYRAADGAVAGLVGAILDITEERRSAAALRASKEQLTRALDRQHALARCSQQLLSPAVTPAAREQLLMRALTHLLDASACGRISLWQNVEAPELGLCPRRVADACAPGTLPLAQAPLPSLPLVPWALTPHAHRQRLADGHASGGPVEELYAGSPLLDTMRQASIQATLVVPIHMAGSWWGVLAFDADHPYVWDDDEQRVLRTGAELFGQVIRRWEAEDALREQAVLDARAETLSRVNVELTQALRLKDEFLAMMSHELRTPLNVVLGITETLAEELYGPITDRQRQALTRITSGGRHLLAILSDILDLADLAAGDAALDVQPLDVDSLCRTALDLIQAPAQAKGIQLFRSMAADLEGLRADARRLTQILTNLLDNAVKFTPAGGSVGLEVATDAAQDAVAFTVWDTGIGIAEADYGRLFQPFTQVDGRLVRQYEGIGLGLTLLRRLVELHGGSVSVESVLGHGSRFTVRLPWSPEEHGTPVPPHGLSPTSRAWVTPPRLVIADDHERTLQFYGKLLREQGCEVALARTGVEAVVQVRATRPTVAVIDLQMPELDGLSALRQIRADPEVGATPIIALTALAMPGDRERCLAAGAAAYLAKPIGIRTLMATIAEVLTDSNRGHIGK